MENSVIFNVFGDERKHEPVYLELMETVLSAYSVKDIDEFYEWVKTEGLREHGFPRLTANIGIMISYGRRADLRERFVQMMDMCCEEIPKRKLAGNEFSIKEIIFCLLKLEEKGVFPQEQIDGWKDSLKNVTVENCYLKYATEPDTKEWNWAAFTMISEWMRYQTGAAPLDETFIDNQLTSQWQWVDENNMYRDPNQPMVYDLVTRGLIALMFHLGYRGKYYSMWDTALQKAGLLTLRMFSVTGTIPYGGRSNQFINNEAHAAVVFEYEAKRYARQGDMETAGRFKKAAKLAVSNMSAWLSRTPINHIKNSFPRELEYGCEFYSYFRKYMITAASFMFAAYMISDNTIEAGELDDVSGDSWQTTDDFHKVFLRAGEYFAEYDYCADYEYDASGLGRLHRKGAPEMICLSVPASAKPLYNIHAEAGVPFAIVPEVLHEGKWLSGADEGTVHKVEKHNAHQESASLLVNCTWPCGKSAGCSFFLDKEGMLVTVKGEKGTGLLLPAFRFDGSTETEITCTGDTLSIKYQNWICRYRTENGVIRNTGTAGYNRNGHYTLFRAEGGKDLSVRIEIFPAE